MLMNAVKQSAASVPKVAPPKDADVPAASDAATTADDKAVSIEVAAVKSVPAAPVVTAPVSVFNRLGRSIGFLCHNDDNFLKAGELAPALLQGHRWCPMASCGKKHINRVCEAFRRYHLVDHIQAPISNANNDTKPAPAYVVFQTTIAALTIAISLKSASVPATIGAPKPAPQPPTAETAAAAPLRQVRQ